MVAKKGIGGIYEPCITTIKDIIEFISYEKQRLKIIELTTEFMYMDYYQTMSEQSR